jgi:hypothetical protein
MGLKGAALSTLRAGDFQAASTQRIKGSKGQGIGKEEKHLLTFKFLCSFDPLSLCVEKSSSPTSAFIFVLADQREIGYDAREQFGSNTQGRVKGWAKGDGVFSSTDAIF